MLPGSESPPHRMSRRAKIVLWVSSVAVVVLGGLVAASLLVKVPYLSLGPGSMYGTTELVVIEGVETFDPEGDVLLSTVKLRGRLTLWGVLHGWLDPAISVKPEEEVLGDRDRAENTRINRQLMDVSKQVATFVALERLGYEVTVTGTGSIIADVAEGTPADGLLAVGDTVVAVDGEVVSTSGDLIRLIGERSPGERVTLTVEPHPPLEDGAAVAGGTEDAGGGEPALEPEDLTVVLAARSDDPDKAFLGVVPETRDVLFEFPFEVDFDTGRVGGPSAGLAFTLALLDVLTPGELTGGVEVGVTGTMDLAGNVGPIGGIEQKVAAARRAGIRFFIIPAVQTDDEKAIAREQAGDEVELFEVETLEDALEVLESLGGDPIPTG